MSGDALGMNGLPPWDGKLIHYTCDPTRSDIVLRMSHMIADGQLILKLLRQILVPLDDAAMADYAVTVLGSSSGTVKKKQQHSEQHNEQQQQRIWLLWPVFFLGGLFMALLRCVDCSSRLVPCF
jgi:hypothetical protein